MHPGIRSSGINPIELFIPAYHLPWNQLIWNGLPKKTHRQIIQSDEQVDSNRLWSKLENL